MQDVYVASGALEVDALNEEGHDILFCGSVAAVQAHLGFNGSEFRKTIIMGGLTLDNSYFLHNTAGFEIFGPLTIKMETLLPISAPP